MESTVYQFDVVAKYYLNASDCTWASSTANNYFAVIPLELGKVYKVTCQNITDLTKFQCVQSDSGVVGEDPAISVVVNDWSSSYAPTDGTYLSFVATKNYLICTGGKTYGGELSVTCSPLFSVVGTKWKMHPTAMWRLVGYQYFKIDGAFYEGNTVLTELSSANNIFIGKNAFGYNGQSGTQGHTIFPAPMVDSYYANERWCVVKGAYATGSGYPMRDLTDTLYLEITGGEDATNLDLIAWLYGAGELHDKTNITYNDATVEMKSGQTATIDCAGEIALTDIVITPEFSVKIAYGDIINAAHKGQTATLKCAGKKMKHDVVISTKAEDNSIVGTWAMNETITLPFGNTSLPTYSSYTVVATYYIAGLVLRCGTTEWTDKEYITISCSSNTYRLSFSNGGSATAVTYSFSTNAWNWHGSFVSPYIITIPDGAEVVPTDNSGTDSLMPFETWLKANATKQ